MADILDRIKVALSDRYAIEREIGSGGMATVYLARDLKHDRKVAVKVLRPQLAASLGSDRFLREIKITANLNHPHILPLLDSGAADGFLYYVMPYVEGGSLRDRLNREKQLPIADALELTSEIGDALGHAHSLGFVHRDVKPENILFEAGHAVVSDFGIARAVTEAGDERLTDTGVAIGTPAYMSPEQGAGEQQLDGRSDIYSLGCLLYEMLGGDPPYTGSTPQAILARKVTDPVPSLKAVRETVPDEIEHVVIRALAKAPADRFATATEFVAALKGKEPVPAPRARVATRRRRLAGWLAGALALLVIASGVALMGSSSNVAFSERDWIVIADLENSTGDSVFDQSLNAALTIAVQQSRYVNVVSASRVQQTLERMGRDSVDALTEALAREIAVRENAAVVVVPSISQVDSVYSLAIRVVDPGTGDNLTARSARVTGRTEVLDALDRLARQLRRDLGESVLAVVRRGKRLPQVTTRSLEALKAWAAGGEPGLPLDRSGEFWLRAVALDSNFAMAHSDLGYYYLWWLNDRVKAEQHFDKALSLSDRVTEKERLLIQANVASWRGDRAGAANTYEVYLTQYPDDAWAWYQLGYCLMMVDRSAEALAAFDRVLELDPFSVGAYINIATIHTKDGRPAEAVPHYLKAFELRPDALLVGTVNHEFGFTLVSLGELERAEAAFTAMLRGSQSQRANGLRSLALLRMYSGSYDAAIAYLQQAAAVYEATDAPVSELRTRLYLATAYRANGSTGAAHQELARARELGQLPSVAPEWLAYLGRPHARGGMVEETERILADALARMDEDNRYDRTAVSLLRGELALARGEPSEAISHFRTAYALRQDNYCLESLAHAHFAAGDLTAAETRYLEVVADPELGWEAQEPWILAHYQLGKLYELQGNVAKALEYYGRLLEIWNDGDDDLEALSDARRRVQDLVGRPQG